MFFVFVIVSMNTNSTMFFFWPEANFEPQKGLIDGIFGKFG